MVIQPLLSRFMSDTKVILIAGLAAAVPLVFSSFGVDKGSFYLLTAISMLSTILFPMLSVALSQRVSPRRQGQLDAATTAVTNFIGAISTVVFGTFFPFSRICFFHLC
jgi:fucose permease